jgi:hypothetical protein
VCSDDRGIENGAVFVDFQLERFEDRGPVTSPRPVREAVENGLPRAKPLRQVTPGYAGLCAVKHGIDEGSVVHLGLGSSSFRNDDADHRPLGIGQSMAVRHAQF